MRDIFNMPIIGSILYGLRSIIGSFLLILKHPSLILFNIYATFFSTIWITLITWTKKLLFLILCWAHKWEYAQLSQTILCENKPDLNLIGGLENIRRFENFSNVYFHIKELLSSPTGIEKLIEAVIIIIMLAALFSHILAFMYYNNYSTTAMVFYIDNLQKNPNAHTFEALKLTPATQKRVWHWALLSTFIFLIIRLTISGLFNNFPFYHLCKGHKFGLTPFTNSLVMLISFYAPNLLAYKKFSLRKMITHLFTTTMKMPIATVTIVALLSLGSYLLPSCILPSNSIASTLTNPMNFIIWILYIITYLITPITQIFLYRQITNKP